MQNDEGWTENGQRPTIAPHCSDSFIGGIIIPNGDFVLGDDGHFRRVVPDGAGGYRRDDDYFAPLRDGSVEILERSAFEGTFEIDSQMVSMSDVDPEDDDLEDTEIEDDEDDLCEHGIPYDECDDCDEELCPHGYTEDEECPTCDGDDLEDTEDLGEPDDEDDDETEA